MKRLVSALLALSLLSGSAAFAESYGHGGQGNYNGYNSQGYHDNYGGRGRGDRGWDRGRGHFRHGHNDGTAIAAGVGILALIAIMSSQDRHDRDQGVYNRDGAGYQSDRGRPDGNQAYRGPDVGQGDYTSGYDGRDADGEAPQD